MEATRMELVAELDNWEKSLINAPTMKWVVGGAGEGKTALLLTFADLCKGHKRSVGAFFASNRITDCSDGSRIVATLAVQLMQSLPSTAKHIEKALRQDPHILSKGREVQMKALIVEPVKRIATTTRLLAAITFGLKSYPKLIVIDGLDEVTGKDVQTDIIKIIGNTIKDIRLPLRLLISSRPEPHIVEAVQGLRSRFPKDRISTMDLREDVLVHRDIRRYFKVKFAEIRAKDDCLPVDWPGEAVIEQLVDKASGQFIYAATVMRYIMFEYHSPDERLAIIRGLLKTPPGDKPYDNLDELYLHIVRNATRGGDILQILALLIVINQLISTANAPAGTFTQLCSPLKLGEILGLKRGEVRRCLTDMHSVVNVGDDKRDIQIYHKSFPDFLLDRSRSKEFSIDLQASHGCLYSHLVGASHDRDTILRILGQVMLAEGMPSDVDIIGSPANTSSPDRVGVILGLESGDLARIVTDVRLVLQVGEPKQDIKILDHSFRVFLLDRSRSKELYVDLDDARLTLRDMYDQVYSHLISSSQHRNTILQVLGQIIIAKDMSPHMDIIGSPANATHPDRIETILGLEPGAVLQAISDVRMTLEVGDTNIKIQDPNFQDFLLDYSRSKGLYVDLNHARFTLQLAAPIRKVFGAQGTCTILSVYSL